MPEVFLSQRKERQGQRQINKENLKEITCRMKSRDSQPIVFKTLKSQKKLFMKKDEFQEKENSESERTLRERKL